MARIARRKSKKLIEGAKPGGMSSVGATLNVPAAENDLPSGPLLPGSYRVAHVVNESGKHIEVRTHKLGSADSDRDTMEYAKILAHAVETFGSRTNANAWLNKPNRVFHNHTPLQILTEDPGAVEEELVRIDHGMFI
jgi:hypothetical protein